MCTKARKRAKLQARDICRHSLIKTLYTHELKNQVEQLRKMRQRNPNPLVPRRSKRGQNKVSPHETKEESSQPQVERHEAIPVKMPKVEVEVYEGRTRSQISQQINLV